jgi:Rad3-related DNA helicase
VLGGIFGEGIDLKDEKLVGAIIIGTGLPQVCFERELLKNHFDEEGEDGFDYAYKYPGINKVLQAAGRVIRTESDRGIIALLDDRFLQNSYKSLYPREWNKLTRVDITNSEEYVREFWEEGDCCSTGSHKKMAFE